MLGLPLRRATPSGSGADAGQPKWTPSRRSRWSDPRHASWRGPPWARGGWPPRPDGPRPRHGLRLDLLPSLIVAIVALGWASGSQGGDPGARAVDAFSVIMLLAGSASLIFRRAAPRLVLAITTAVAIAYPLMGYPATGAFLVPLAVAVFSVTAAGHRRAAIVAVVIYLAAFVAFGVVGGQVESGTVLVVPLWLVGVLVGGEAARNRQAFFAEAHRRAEEAERSQLEEQRRRDSEERVRIAREVHDVISHSIAMINVQAGVAAHLLDDDPEQARTALVAIKNASKEALGDLRTTLGVLRDVDSEEVVTGSADREGVGDRAPAPRLARLDELAERTRAAGLAVEVELDGVATPPLPAGVDLAAYRIVQEAVSNVIRHAQATAVDITVRRETGRVVVEVVDDGVGVAPPPQTRRGRDASAATAAPAPVQNGIRGMRERAAALGGSLEAKSGPDGGFRVRAELPISGQE